MKRICLALVFLISFGFLTDQVRAFRLSPAFLELEIKRGQSQTKILNVNNDTENPVLCQAGVTGFEVLKDGKQVFETARADYSAAEWIKIKKLEFDIPAKGSEKVEVAIEVPKTVQPGDYFACVFVQTRAPGKVKSPQAAEFVVGVNFRLGCIVRITVPGKTIPKEAEVSELKVEMPTAESQNSEIKVSAILTNKSRLHLDAQGEVLIKNSANRVFDRFILQGRGKNVRGEALVYPMGEREFSGTIQRPLPAGDYVAEVSFSYGSHTKAKAKTAFVVSPELGKEQKSLLVLKAEPNPLQITMPSGAFRALPLKIENLDFEPLKVSAKPQTSWLETDPDDFEIRSGHFKSIRVKISTADKEPTARTGKIVLTPERGKPLVVDVIVFAPKPKEKEK